MNAAQTLKKLAALGTPQNQESTLPARHRT